MSPVNVDEGRRFSFYSCAQMNELSQRGKILNSNYCPVKTFSTRGELLRCWQCPLYVGVRVHARLPAHVRERERESAEQKRGSLSSSSLRARTHTHRQNKRQEISARSTWRVFWLIAHQLWFSHSLGSVLEGQRQKHCFQLNWGPPNSSAFRRTRAEWRRKTVTKACRTPESWTDLMTSLQVSETGWLLKRRFNLHVLHFKRNPELRNFPTCFPSAKVPYSLFGARSLKFI